MKTEILETAERVAERAAELVLEAAEEVAERSERFTFAVSGGRTPWLMLRALAGLTMPWSQLHVFQVDERIAPAKDAERNLTHLEESLLRNAPISTGQIHAMPVEVGDLEGGASDYAATLGRLAGSPPVLDLVHLGLGTDGHTASLVPEDPVLDVTDHDVALTGEYQGRRRMTLTYPLLNRARRILWLVTGEEKAEMLRRLLDGDETIPAGRVRTDRAIVLADAAAVSETARQ